jgi:hypothetical protein
LFTKEMRVGVESFGEQRNSLADERVAADF